MELTSHQTELLERGVKALERLAEDPVVEIESGPPICPACNRVNPVVRVNENGGQGPLYELFTVARCTGCDTELYVVPMHVEIFTSREELVAEITQRKGGSNGN